MAERPIQSALTRPELPGDVDATSSGDRHTVIRVEARIGGGLMCATTASSASIFIFKGEKQMTPRCDSSRLSTYFAVFASSNSFA
jgi:hypothetical protein